MSKARAGKGGEWGKFIHSKWCSQTGRAISNVALMNSSSIVSVPHKKRRVWSPLLSSDKGLSSLLICWLWVGSFSFCFPARDLKKNHIHSLLDNQFGSYRRLEKL